MRTKVTLVLLFLNVALFFFIFKFERNWRTERASLEARRRVLGAEAADIRSLTVLNGATTLYSLKRNGEAWQLTTPLDWPANSATVSRIVNELQFLDHETAFAVADLKANGQSLADYGLENPKVTVEFSNASVTNPEATPIKTKLQLGDITKIGNRLYVLSPDGKRIHVVSRALADSLAVTLDKLRADSLLTIPGFEARALRIQSTTSVALHRDDQRWTFDTPIVARASKSAIDLALNELGALRAKAFITENLPSTLPAAAPAYRITVEGNNRRETLLLGQPVAAPVSSPNVSTGSSVDYYAQLEGRAALFTVALPVGPKSLKETLDKAQESLRDKRVLDFEPGLVTAISLRAPNTPGQPTLTLQRLEAAANSADTAAWQIIRRDPADSAPQPLPADRAAVQRLLEQLRLLGAESFTSDAPTAADLERLGFARPEREIVLTLAKPPGLTANSAAPAAPSTLTLRLGLNSERDNFAYANVVGAAFVYAVNPDILRLETPTAPAAWRERLLRDLPPGARITMLRLTDRTTNQPVLDLTLDEAGNPPATTPQLPAVAAVLSAVRTLRAKSFPQEGFTEKVLLLGEDRPWRYRLDATLALPGAAAGAPAPVSTLLLSERFGGTQQLAGSREFNAVFDLEQPFVDALWSITYQADPGPFLPK